MDKLPKGTAMSLVVKDDGSGKLTVELSWNCSNDAALGVLASAMSNVSSTPDPTGDRAKRGDDFLLVENPIPPWMRPNLFN